MYWTQRDGKKILIKDMSDSHLINSINMINRKYGDYEILGSSIYYHLCAEASLRKLDFVKRKERCTFKYLDDPDLDDIDEYGWDEW